MCKALGIARSTYYAYKEKTDKKDNLNDKVVQIYNQNQCVYGTRKIKAALANLGVVASRRRIGKIMKENGLISAYTKVKYKIHKTKVNESLEKNIVDRVYKNRTKLEVIVSDLTYVRVGLEWNYICILLDLHNREIAGYSCGKYKDAQLVHKAFASVSFSLYNVQIFHTDRGSEFNNYLIDDLLKEFGIQRSLSSKGCPYDNAVAEAQFKIIKTEFVRNRRFDNLGHLEMELAAYVYWFNNKRLHGSLGYKSPIDFKNSLL